jgi:multidrug resistance efflux pump
MPATAMFEIVNVSSLKLTVTVDESQVANLKLGSPVNVTASVYPDVMFTGKSLSSPQKQIQLEFPSRNRNNYTHHQMI